MSHPSVLTIEELTLVRDSILLFLLISVVEKNRSDLKYSDMSLKQLFIASTDLVLDLIKKDYLSTKTSLKKSGIKVIEVDGDANSLKFEIYFRGYQERFQIMKFLVKSQLGVALGNYAKRAEELIRLRK
ncbi:hypothetical protein ACFQZE_06595 [Paenibacillus sp. GCM10027627]|uniref:hypothetical protein n=1 Tax=unclassified Paenibacillus TaxID=185978 RepID=UPI00363B7B2B